LVDLNHWKWHFLSLANTLVGNNTQIIAPPFKSHEVTSIFSVVSGYDINLLYSGVEIVNIISVCIVRLLYPLEFLPRRKVFFPIKTHFFPWEEIPFFRESTQPWLSRHDYLNVLTKQFLFNCFFTVFNIFYDVM